MPTYMSKYLLFFLFILRSSFSFSQIDSAIEASDTKWYADKFKNLIEKPNEVDLVNFIDNLSLHTVNSTISLKVLKSYISKIENFYKIHPELAHTRYLLNFTKAVMEMYMGHPEKFRQIIAETELDLKREKRYKELFHLNLQICHFLPSVNYRNEAKEHFYENEKLLSDLKGSGISNFKGFEAVQNANSFGYLFLTEEQIDSAEKYFRIGLGRAVENKDSAWIGIISGNLGAVLFRKGNYAQAEKLLIIDKTESIKSNQITSGINAIFMLADLKLSQGDLKTSEAYLNEAGSLLKQLNINDEEILNYYFIEESNKLGHLFMLKGDFKNADIYYQRAHNKLKSLLKQKLPIMTNLNNRRYAFEDNAHKISELEDRSQRRQYIIWFIALLLISLLIILYNQRRFNQRLKEKNSQIEEQAKVLQELNAQKSKLFSVVAHDMRSPFANLRNLIDLHADKALSDEEFLLFCKDINKSIHGLSGTFENIMSWAKVGMEQGIKVNIESLNFASIISEIILQINPICEVKSISIQYTENATNEFLADKNLMLVVLRNLIHNAIKFSHAGSKISVLYSVNSNNNSEALIEIIDKGIGIDDEMLDKLNNSNSKLSLNGTQGEKGSGLGLMICNEFILAMNGRLKIESKLDEGSTFTIFLPLNIYNK